MSATMAAPDGAWPSPTVRLPLWAGLLATLLLPLASLWVPGGEIIRHAYPVVALACAAIWVDKAPGSFIAFASWLFMFTPLARRMIDLQTGYIDPNPVMLAPYLALIVCAPHGLAYILSGRRHSATLLVICLAIAWSLGLGLVRGQTTGALFDALKWMSPLLFLAYVLSGNRSARIGPGLITTLALFTLLAAVYALVQFALVPEWDAYWISMSPIGSSPIGIIGPAEPFELRVFGSMNSPHSLSSALAICVILLAAAPRSTFLLVAGLAFAAIAVTLQRSIAAELVVVLAMLACVAGRRIRGNILVLALLGAAAALASLSYIEIDLTPIIERFSLGADLASDESFNARLAQYENLVIWLADQPEGRGFGWRSFGDGIFFILDSGLIDSFLSLGIVGGMAYLGGVAALLLAALRTGFAAGGLALAASFAFFFNMGQLAFGFPLIGEHGFFTFLAAGLALAPTGLAREADVVV